MGAAKKIHQWVLHEPSGEFIPKADPVWNPHKHVPKLRIFEPTARELTHYEDYYIDPRTMQRVIRPNTPVEQKTAYNLYVPKREPRIIPIWWSIWCAIAVDASSPARWAEVTNSDPDTLSSASYTAPTDCLLVMCGQMDGADDSLKAIVASDSGGLSWTDQVRRSWSETTAGGLAFIATARTTSSVSRTSRLSTSGGNSVSLQASSKQYNLTGVDVDGTPVDTVGASNEGGSTTNNLTTSSVTPGANGLLICSDCDWSASGSFAASSDLTQDTAHYTGAISVCSGYKTCSSGVGVTGNLNASGTAAVQHKWCQVTVREAAAGGTTRGTPFGHRSTAFNGGRTFLGNIR